MFTGTDTSNKDDGRIAFATAAAGTVAERMRIESDGKIGINETGFSYTDYSIFHIKGRGSDDSNVTGMTFHAGGTDGNQRNWSITTNNSAHGSMDFRVSNANNNTPNTNLGTEYGESWLMTNAFGLRNSTNRRFSNWQQRTVGKLKTASLILLWRGRRKQRNRKGRARAKTEKP